MSTGRPEIHKDGQAREMEKGKQERGTRKGYDGGYDVRRRGTTGSGRPEKKNRTGQKQKLKKKKTGKGGRFVSLLRNVNLVIAILK